MSLNDLEKRLSSVTNSQDSIQGLSLWMLHHKSHHKTIVDIWFNSFNKAKAGHRLTLFYLANDVIQHAKRKGVNQYVDHFVEYLKKATSLCVDDEKIRTSMGRVLDIWLERSIYSEDVIDELKGSLSGKSGHLAAVSRIVAEFKLSDLIDKIKKTKKIEEVSVGKLESLVNCKVDATSGEVLNKLKDKTHGEQFSRDFDDATNCLETVISALEKEVHSRTDLIESLEKSEIFYETQKDEAKTVVDAYKNFGLRVRNVWRKLEETRSSLPSPLPSPPRDAPSPTNSDDGPTLPQVDVYTSDVNAFLRRVASDQPKGVNPITPSLDQRLSNLMSHVNDLQKNDSNDLIIHKNNSQSIQSIPQIQTINNNNNNNNYTNNNNNNNWIQNPFNDQNMRTNYPNESLYPSPHQSSQPIYDYNYSQPIPDMNRHQSTGGVQQIQPLVSTRGQQMSSQMSDLSSIPPIISNMPFHDYSSSQPSEIMHPTDMELSDSDNEDINRSQTLRPIKVIETRRNSGDTSIPDFNVPNNDRLYANNNHMTNSNNVSDSRVPPYIPPYQPTLKQPGPRPQGRPALNSVVQPMHPYYPSPHPNPSQWRTPRSAVMPAQHYSPMNAPTHPLIRHPHNRRPYNHNNNNTNNNNNINRNNRLTRY